ncbi:MAG TPA: PAS domain S-box protein [Bryobacteraceae bacterium]|nr:PAS domain S-box protein [Bryobacteraceae bacterium]
MKSERFRVLLVEDNPGDARLLRETIRETNDLSVDLIHEDTLQRGLDRIGSDRFDVIMLDLSLPDEEGLETVVRTHAAAPKIPIIVLTGHDDADLASRAVRAGAQDYLVKGQVSHQLLTRSMRYASERKKATDQLQGSELYFRSLIENANDIIAVVDRAGRITYSSPSMARQLGLSGENLSGTHLVELVHPEDRMLVESMLQTGWNRQSPTPYFEFRWRRFDGSWRIAEGIGQQLKFEEEQRGLVLNARDITERKQTEEALRDLNETLQALIETSPLAILWIDLGGRISAWNSAAEQIFGFSDREAIGNELETLMPDCAAFLSARGESKGRHNLTGEETRFRRRDGTFVEVSVWQTKLRQEEGRALGQLILVADNTDRKRLEEQFRQSQKMEAVGRLAGGVAHDFNNLLTVVTGYCQLLIDQLSPGDPMVEDLKQVFRAAERGTGLTRQLLAFGRQQIVQPRVVDLSSLLADMNHILRRILGEGIELLIAIPPNTAKIRVDPGQIEQVVVNMVVNARDAMPGGGKLTIETQNLELGEEEARLHSVEAGSYVMLAISDTGVGMDNNTKSHLFEPFFTTKERGRGTGLGLSTSYGIVKQNRGNIAVYSELGRGTVFKIMLPRVFDPAEPELRPLERAQKGGGEKILVVEDEDAVRRVVQEMLEHHGYDVMVAPGGQDALAIFANQAKIDLLITDVVMPNMSGRELAQRLVASVPDLKVLYVSGYTDSAIVHHGVLEPGVHFLQKPFTPDQLARKVREVLDR